MLTLHSTDKRFVLYSVVEEAYQYLQSLRTPVQVSGGVEILTRAEVETASGDNTFTATTISGVVFVSQDSLDNWYESVYLAA